MGCCSALYRDLRKTRRANEHGHRYLVKNESDFDRTAMRMLGDPIEFEIVIYEAFLIFEMRRLRQAQRAKYRGSRVTLSRLSRLSSS